MNLTVQKINSSFKDLEKLEVLNQEAFPDEERMPIQEMIDLAEKKELDLWALYDNQQFIGFYETGYFMGYKGLKMEVLCNQSSFRKTEFEALLKNLKIREIPF